MHQTFLIFDCHVSGKSIHRKVRSCRRPEMQKSFSPGIQGLGINETTYLKQWVQFSSERNQDPFHPPFKSCFKILTLIRFAVLDYSVFNTIRSKLSSFGEIDGIEVGKYPFICRYMKGPYNMNRSLPKHNFKWDWGGGGGGGR